MYSDGEAVIARIAALARNLSERASEVVLLSGYVQ
jgi:hypothetical protein